jgi:endonuclease YncB( thermonuclease family)
MQLILSTEYNPLAATGGGLPQSELPIAKRLDSGLLYPAEVLRIIDGDTFEARVRVWPGLDVDTKVRLRGIVSAAMLNGGFARAYNGGRRGSWCG